tara:strand:+ start:871 stop:1083 length:213 start_codon:yes stop_codon:yes gene_type:complete
LSPAFSFSGIDVIGVFIVLFVAFNVILCFYFYDKRRELGWKTSIHQAIEKNSDKKPEKAGKVVQFRRPED